MKYNPLNRPQQKYIKEDAVVFEKYSLDSGNKFKNIEEEKNQETQHLEEKNIKIEIDKQSITNLNDNNKNISEIPKHELPEKAQEIKNEGKIENNDKKENNNLIVIPKPTLDTKANYLENQLSNIANLENLAIGESLNISAFDYFKYLLKKSFCMKRNEKEQLIEKADKLYKQELDITCILKKIHEIDKLKSLILDKDQLVLFNYLDKPHISLKSKEEKRSLTLGNLPFDRNQIAESYFKCNEERGKNEISTKLVEICDLKKVKKKITQVLKK